MDNLEFDLYDYLVTVTKISKEDYKISVTKAADKIIVDEFTLTGYQGEDGDNWEKLAEENPSREPILRQILANLDAE